MKKITSLIIPIGLLVMLLIIIISSAPASAASPGNPISRVERSNPEITEPPWFNIAWHYRRQVVISYSEQETLPYYQVLIMLDINNFNFSHTKPNGEDIRFTHSDGITELKFWIESWDSLNRLAYVWVRVPSVPHGNTTIYLYYNNPSASSVSDGITTFDSFDDNWSQFSREGSSLHVEPQIGRLLQEVISPFDWLTISGSPEASSGILSLGDGDGIKSTSTYLYEAVGMRANYNLSSVDEWIGFINGTGGQRTMISDHKPGNVDDIYLLDSVDGVDFEYVVLPIGGGENWHGDYHVYELRWKSGQSKGDIDHGTSSASSSISNRVPSIALPVTLYNDIDSSGILQVDWVYVRQYRDPEPTSSVQTEQGLVELSIVNSDYPDPVRKNAKLTYQLTIANNSSINAVGVVVTDTLPGNVQIGQISASQGSCEPGSIILCDLDVIIANSFASVTIEVTPTVDGEIINIASVSSPGYELNLSDNTNEQTTLVDSQPPEVIWEKPVSNGNIFFTFDRTVYLETTATDNDQIDRVEFWWYDGAVYWHIGTVTNPPYQASFDTNVLVPGIPYWFEARGYDRAGNSNFPYDRSYIYIIRNNTNYLPLVRR